MKSALAILAVLVGPVAPLMADSCRNVVRRHNVVVLDSSLVITPFAIPVAVPVSYAVPSVLYSYNGQQAQPQYAAPRAAAAPQAQSQDAEWQEFLAWKAARAKVAAAPQSFVAAKCASCHNPGKKGAASFDLSLATHADLRHATALVAEGKMPPKTAPRLSAEEVGKVIHELSTMPVADAAQAEPQVRASDVPQPEAPPPEPVPNPESR